MIYNNTSLVKQFERQVALNADRPAICSQGQKLSYQTLNERSNQVARSLVSRGVQPGDIIGLLFDRSADFLIAMWGVLKAGATYLPLEPELPRKRITFMLEKSNASTIITQPKYADQYIDGFSVHMLEDSIIKSQPKDNLDFETNSSKAAYCIFTSGSSGYPKGVLMKQSSVINLVQGLKQLVYDGYQDRKLNVALIASFSFDASVQQIFPALLQGHTLYITDDESRKDGQSLRQFFNTNKIDISDGTPTHLRILVKACQLGSCLETLSTWLLAGEVLGKNTVREFYEKCGYPTQLYNLYGPTETCVDSTYYKVNPINLDNYESIPIGKPLPNERIYVVDAEGNVVPQGEVGELCIAGEGLAEAYVNDKELTLQKFNKNWIQNESRVYRTGDMVRLLSDGNLLYQGRIDNQIKLRGLRIELSEIEFQTCTHELVNHAVVVVKEIFQEEQLVLYYESNAAIEESVLRDYLMERLPNYMIPSHYVYMEALPLNVSGKVDRYALPDVEVIAESNTGNLSDIEKQMIQIWEEVMEVPQNWVGLETNFFQLGGNSLKAVLIANRMRKEFGVEITVAQFFEFQTISNFSKFITEATKVEQARILPSQNTAINPLTLAQKCFYFINSLQNKNSVTYNIPQVFELNGNVSLEQFNVAFRKLIQRYDILRTTFYEKEEGIQAQVAEAESFDFSVETVIFNGDIENSILLFLKPFDLNNGPLFKAGLLTVNPDQQFLVFDIHHIISDEVSNRILIQDLLSLYNGEQLQDPKLHYRDYAVWQQEEYYQKVVAEHKDYWLNIYSNDIPVLDLPTDHARPMELSDEAYSSTIKLEKALADQIRQLVARENTTTFNFLLAAFYIFLNKISHQENIVVGTPASGRPHGDLEDIVGLFVGALALKNKPKGELSIRTFLSELKENTIQALDHQFYPYLDLVDELKIPRDINRNPLFDVCFNYNQKAEEQAFGTGALKLKPYDLRPQIAKFDLTLDIIDSQEEVELSLVGRKDLFESSTIERFAAYFRQIVEQALSDIDQQIKTIDVLPASEKEQLLSYNQSNGMQEMSVLEVFSQQVQNTPDNIAISFRDQSITYRELERQSDQLANYLVSKGLDQEIFVGLFLDRSVEMVVTLLAILKVGSAYVPLDPEFPEQRIAFQLEDANIKWVVTTSKYAPALKAKGCNVIALDEEQDDILSSSDTPMGQDIKPNDLMYVIYTSGSTGRPKGVLVEHRGLVNMTFSLIERFHLTPKDRLLQFARITFDASISEILMALFSGAALVLVEKETIIDGESIIQYMQDQEVSFAFFTPAYLKVLDKEKLKFLRCIVSGGEAANVDDLQYLSQYMECHNVYGPTECSAIVSGYEVDSNKTYATQIPIGTAFTNLKAYILDQNNQLCPTGIPGELCIAGIGVCRGYLNRPELTKEKFVADPFDPSVPMYRTGDYARWNKEGQIEFLGRKDSQIKIRGFRIELGEIEALLDESNLVKQASVLVTEDNRGNKQIVAYVVPNGDYDSSTLQDYLGSKLPNYMTPSYLVTVDEIPLTSHGKVDRNQLIKQKAAKPEVVQPVNAVEQQLLQIWSQELGIQADLIGTNDNFFDLGGNSLNAMQVIIKTNACFNTDITISDAFKFQTIKQLAKQIEIDQWLDQAEPVSIGEKRKEAVL